MSRKLVLFDCDGTLVDSQSFLHAQIHRSVRAAGGPELTPEMLRDFHALSLKGFLATLDHVMTAEQIVVASQHMIEAITANRLSDAPDEKTYPGILEVLDQLESQGYLLGIVTNKFGRGLELVLKANGIHDRFITLNHADNAPPKPAPNMVLNGMRDAGVDAADCLVIGDSVLDVLAAKNAGVASIAVTWAGRDARELEETGAWAVVSDVADLVPAINRYWQA